MTTLRARWEKPDYTGVTAEVPIWHVPHPEISQTNALSLEFLIFIPVSADMGRFVFLRKAAPPPSFNLSKFSSSILECEAFQMCLSRKSFLGSLLPGIWNVPDWETCIFF
jgi:hypothetical protein